MCVVVVSVWVVTAVVVSHSVCGCCFSLGRDGCCCLTVCVVVVSVWVVTAVVVSHSVCGCCFSLGRDGCCCLTQCVLLLFQSGS